MQCNFEDVDYTKLCIFRIPSEIGSYSLDGERNFHDDARLMKWIHRPLTGWNGDLTTGLDLNKGYARAIKKDFDVLEKGTPILNWMMRHQGKIRNVFMSPKSHEVKIEFVCSRGLLTKISSTPYANGTDWTFCASKFKSVIYLVAFETDRQINERRKETERTKRMISYGAKFEQYMTCDTPHSKPNTSGPVNEREECHVVLRGQLNGHNLLYNAEVDGKDPDNPASYSNHDGDLKSMDCYVELKTACRGKNFKRNKLLRWWLQSFIGGVPRIVCGFRNEEGVVQKLETFEVQDIPDIANNLWNKDKCLQFCYHILSFVKTCVQEDNPQIVYKFSYDTHSPHVTCEQLVSPGKYKILPDWFTGEFNIHEKNLLCK